MSTKTNTSPVDTAQAIRAMERANARETFAHIPALLPIIATKKSHDGRRYLVTAQGYHSPVTVWQDDAPALKQAAKDAPTGSAGFKLLPVLLSATTTEAPERTVEGVTMPARTFYNLTARPMLHTANAEDLFA